MIKNIVLKEWKEIKTANSLLWLTLVAPILFLTMSIVFTLSLDPNSKFQSLQDLLHIPFLDLHKLSGPGIMLRFFIPFFMVLCTMIPVNYTCFSIISEKMSGSMESVLLTPISTRQFLLGKILAYSVPAVIVTWVIQIIYILFIILPLKSEGTYLSWAWLTIMFLLVPFISVISVGLSTLISAKVNNIAAARQLGGLLSLPVTANAVAQVMVSSFVTQTWIHMLLLVFIAICAFIVVKLNISLFDRENIIERWK